MPIAMLHHSGRLRVGSVIHARKGVDVQLREAVIEIHEKGGYPLRQIAEGAGVDIAQLSRFVAGRGITFAVAEKLCRALNYDLVKMGEPLLPPPEKRKPGPKPKAVRKPKSPKK